MRLTMTQSLAIMAAIIRLDQGVRAINAQTPAATFTELQTAGEQLLADFGGHGDVNRTVTLILRTLSGRRAVAKSAGIAGL